MNEIIKLKELEKSYRELLNSNYITMQEVAKLKGITGVYVIYHDGEIIYIGNTNKFDVRFGVDLKHKSTHTLHKKLLKELATSKNVLTFLNDKCRYRVLACDDKIKAEALEHFAIWVNKPKYNHHIYK